MSRSPDHETRISRLEARVEEIAEEAAVARHLAAMNDRDLADVGIKLDANRKAINALGEQTRARFDHVDRRFEQIDRRFEQVDARFERLEAKVDAGFALMTAKFAEYDQGFAAMRHGFDQTAAGFARITALIEGLEARGAGA